MPARITTYLDIDADDVTSALDEMDFDEVAQIAHHLAKKFEDEDFRVETSYQAEGGPETLEGFDLYRKEVAARHGQT